MANNTESQLLNLIAMDRLGKPISSMSGKLKRRVSKLAPQIEFDRSFSGDRVYGRIETNDGSKARGMKAGIEQFSEAHPRYGAILQGMVAEHRVTRDTHLYFGTNEGSRLSSNDYMGVMNDLGFSEARAEAMYGELMTVSRNLAKKRDEGERSILINQTI